MELVTLSQFLTYILMSW